MLNYFYVSMQKKAQKMHRVSEVVSSRMAQSWPWGSQIAVKKFFRKADL